jgi:D-3-phosphoglycerate dehydrogenase
MPNCPRIVVLNPTCLDALELARPRLDELGVDLVTDPGVRTMTLADADRFIAGADALVLPSIVRTLPHDLHMEKHTQLKALAIAASGFDWLDAAAATRNGIVVTNVVGGLATEVVADLAMGMMLAVARKIPHHDRRMRSGDNYRSVGSLVFGKTLGIVGLGRIGRAVAQRAKGFSMKILAAGPRIDPREAAEHGVEAVSLDELLSRSDFVSLHARLTPDTAKLIGPAQLARMKPSAYLINTARIELLDEDALADALSRGALGGAALDDPPSRKDSPLLSMENVVFTPHIGNRVDEAMAEVFVQAVTDARDVLAGRRPARVVNPQVYESPNLRLNGF